MSRELYNDFQSASFDELIDEQDRLNQLIIFKPTEYTIDDLKQMLIDLEDIIKELTRRELE